VAHQVLYREYRPDVFEDVIGQDAIVTALQRALTSGRLAHAYLFSGPRGCGKTTCARIFARCLNCEKGPTATPCGKCPSCLDLAHDGGGSVDVIEMDAASHNGVEDARQLRERLDFAPTRDRYKIVILDEAHMITASAFNALLKIVEEPPEYVKFIFATTEPHKVIETIRSRTYHYAFRLVPSAVMIPYLKKIVAQEKIEIEEPVYNLVSEVGGGSPRDTLSTLDQLMASAKDNKVDYALASRLLGFTPSEILIEFLEKLANKDIAGLFETIESVVKQGVEPERFVSQILNSVRNAVLVGVISNSDFKSKSDEIKASLGLTTESDLANIANLANRLSVKQLNEISDILLDTLNNMRGPTASRLLLELMLGKFASLFDRELTVPNTTQPVTQPVKQPIIQSVPAHPTVQPTVQSTSKSIIKPVTKLDTQTIVEPATQPASVGASAESSTISLESCENKSSGKQISFDQFKSKWTELTKFLPKSATAFIIKAARFRDVENNVLQLEFISENFLNIFNKNKYASKLLTATFQVFGVYLKTNAYFGEKPSNNVSNSKVDPKSDIKPKAQLKAQSIEEPAELKPVEKIIEKPIQKPANIKPIEEPVNSKPIDKPVLEDDLVDESDIANEEYEEIENTDNTVDYLKEMFGAEEITEEKEDK
jgi:DNA polymerase-3 subunit gamma/tau